MCGIVGIRRFDGGTVQEADLRLMAAQLGHRGPDGEGYWCDGPVGFGHRRLSIIDVAGSPQPMGSAGDRCHVTFNGEIFNYRELRRRLPYPYRTGGDTEALLAAFLAWGAAGVEQLQGQFAYGLYDSSDATLWLFRDRLGVLPLYWYADDDVLLFASEIKALLPVLPPADAAHLGPAVRIVQQRDDRLGEPGHVAVGDIGRPSSGHARLLQLERNHGQAERHVLDRLVHGRKVVERAPRVRRESEVGGGQVPTEGVVAGPPGEGDVVLDGRARHGMQFVVPGLFGTLRSLFQNLGTDPSVSGRTSDYALVGDLVAHNPVLGRGFRTFIPEQFILHTGEGGGTLILDNQYLGTLIEMGVVGLACLVSLFVVVVLCTRNVRRRSSDPATRDLAQSIAAAVMVAMLSFSTFDGLSFPMATSLLFLLVGCAGALRRLVPGEAQGSKL